MNCVHCMCSTVSEASCWVLVLQVVAAFVYYGLVQLVPQLEFVAGESKQCLQGHLTVPVSHSSSSCCCCCAFFSCHLQVHKQQQAAYRHLKGTHRHWPPEHCLDC